MQSWNPFIRFCAWERIGLSFPPTPLIIKFRIPSRQSIGLWYRDISFFSLCHLILLEPRAFISASNPPAAPNDFNREGASLIIFVSHRQFFECCPCRCHWIFHFNSDESSAISWKDVFDPWALWNAFPWNQKKFVRLVHPVSKCSVKWIMKLPFISADGYNIGCIDLPCKYLNLGYSK
jgi:hypothetical protein